MARPQKVGLDYFPLDTVMDTKFELIEAEFGLTGFGVIVKLLQKIYAEQGYYIEWTKEVALLFSRRIAVGGNVVSEIIEASVNRGIFDREKFQSYNILTSQGIQKRYEKVVNRRNSSIKCEYSLLKCTQKAESDTETPVIAHNNSINVFNNATKETKEKETKVNKTKVNKTNGVDSIIDFYEKNIGFISASIYSEIKSYVEGGVEEDLILTCFKTAIDNNKCTWAYARGVLKKLLEKGIKTKIEYEVIKNNAPIIYTTASSGAVQATRSLKGIVYL